VGPRRQRAAEPSKSTRIPGKMAVDEVAEFAEEYNSQLRAMKRPAKEEINALTMVAADYVDNHPFALAVVQVLERCIQEVMRISLL
jgi:phage host-nuclease inhibitor protein Gam